VNGAAVAKKARPTKRQCCGMPPSMLLRRTQVIATRFFTGAVRNPDLPSDVRIKMAEVAAPFVHRKPTKDNPRILASRKHVALMKAVHKGTAARPDGADPKAREPGTLVVEGAAEEEESPLQYLMGVMRDPDIKPELRIRVAQRVVPFVHPRQKRDRTADQRDAELMEALGDEFMADPVLAAKIRDDKLRLEKLRYRHDCRSSYGPPTPAEIKDKAALETRIEETANAIGCPPGYGSKEREIDFVVADRLSKKRSFAPPRNRLTEMELLLEAQAVARLAIDPRTSEQRALAPIEERLGLLYVKTMGGIGSQPDREEYERLRAMHPYLQEKYDALRVREARRSEPNPDDPLYEAALAWRRVDS
jgi:hypothetical protein